MGERDTAKQLRAELDDAWQWRDWQEVERLQDELWRLAIDETRAERHVLRDRARRLAARLGI